MTTLHLVRHGPTHAKTMIGWTDLPADLSDTGAIVRLSDTLPDAPIISSDLTRAIATADAFAGSRPRLPHDPALREIHFGRWEGADFDDVWASENAVARAFWDGDGTTPAPEGESWAQLSERVSGTIDGLLERYDTLIVVAHFGAILSQIQRATGETARQTMARKIDPLSLTTLERRDGTFTLHQTNRRP